MELFKVILIRSLFLLVMRMFPLPPGGRNFSTVLYPPSALSKTMNQLSCSASQSNADSAEIFFAFAICFSLWSMVASEEASIQNMSENLMFYLMTIGKLRN
jgi:hypothetical protein